MRDAKFKVHFCTITRYYFHDNSNFLRKTYNYFFFISDPLREIQKEVLKENRVGSLIRSHEQKREKKEEGRKKKKGT